MAASAWAEEVDESATPTPDPVVDLLSVELLKSGVRVYGEQAFSVLADFGPADASEFRSTLGVRASAPLDDSFALRASVVAQASFFDYDGDLAGLEADLGGVDLFQRLFDTRFALGGIYRLPLNGSVFGLTTTWSVFGEGRAELGWEDGASLGDAVSGSGALGVGFELAPHLQIALGVSVGSRIDEGGVNVSPVVGFRWRIRDGMRLASQGTGLLFAMDLLPELELQLRASYESERYRLDDGDAPPMDLTLRKRDVPVLVALRWSPTRHWRITGGAGSVVYQKWRVEVDDDGGSSSVDAGPAALLVLRAEYRF